MLKYNHFYHGCMRTVITVFGALFSNLKIKRYNSDGTDYQEIDVPLSYAPKQRMLQRLKQNPNIDDREIEVVLPRMAFEVVSMEYDAARRTNNTINAGNTGQISRTMPAPTPYNLHLNLYLYAKNQDDALQMVEQILPFFNPDFNVTINSLPEMNVKEDIPIILDGVSYEDDYEGDLDTRRAIIYTLSFTVKMNFYGPVSESAVITKVYVNVQTDNTSLATPNVARTGNLKYSAIALSPTQIAEEFLYE